MVVDKRNNTEKKLEILQGSVGMSISALYVLLIRRGSHGIWYVLLIGRGSDGV